MNVHQTDAARQQVREQVRQQVRDAMQQAQIAREQAKAAAQEARDAAGQPSVPSTPAVPAAPAAPAHPRAPTVTIDGQNIHLGRARDPMTSGTEVVRFELPPQIEGIAYGTMATLLALFVITPIARAIARRMDRRTIAPNVPPQVASRLERIEQAVEAMAIEIERISEGQRFTTKLLTERAPDFAAAVAAKSADAARVRGGDVRG
jgi:hypothetical protein